MSFTFTKLFSSITESSVWIQKDHVRLFWIYLLARADRRGRVYGSIPGMANHARLTVEQVEEALDLFQQPDPHSRTPDHDGRRIEPIDGGWRLLNHAKYRALRDEEARREYKRDWMRTKREEERESVDTSCPQESTLSTVDRGGPMQRQRQRQSADSSLRSESLAPASPPRKVRKPREPDPLWDSLLGVCRVSGEITPSARGAYNRALADLREAGATPEEVRSRAAVYRRRWPSASLTPTALARRWAECSERVETRPRRMDPRTEADLLLQEATEAARERDDWEEISRQLLAALNHESDPVGAVKAVRSRHGI